MRKHDKRKSGEIREFWLFAQTNLSICLVGRVEKWENKRDLIFSNMEKWKDKKTHLFDWKEKWDDKKCSLYKFTLVALLDKNKIKVTN